MSKPQQTLKAIVGCALCFLLFCSIGFFYLEATKESAAPTGEREESVPYAVPDSPTVAVKADGHTFLFVPDFAAGQVSVFCEELPADYSLCADRQTCAAAIDRFGGLILTVDGVEQRYTGVQVTELAACAEDPELFFADCLHAFCNAVAGQGISQADLVWLFSNCETDLNLPLCFSWPDFLSRAMNDTEIYR